MRTFLRSMDGRSGNAVLGALIAGFVAAVVAVGAVAWGVVAQQRLNAWVVHTYEVETALTQLRFLGERIEVARRGQLLQPDPRFADGFRQASGEIPATVDRIARLTADNPRQQARIATLRSAANAQVAAVGRAFAGDPATTPTAADQLFADGSFEALQQVRALSLAMVDEERRLLGERRAAEQRSIAVTFVVLGLAFLALVLVAAGTIWLVRRNLLDLKASRDSLHAINENLEEAVDVRTGDLRRANEEIQRFAYIVSHDLRSPLVNVMGFTAELDAATKPLAAMIARAETEAPGLVSADVRLAVAEDLPEAIGFIRSSTQKMDRLINAILRLSREGRRMLAPERVDVAEVVQGIGASLAHRMQDEGAELSVSAGMPPVTSDRLALEQIFSNLVENALKYAQKGRPVRIAVRGRIDGGRLVYEVEDNGRGIDPKDHERIFDLFRRSGPQDQPGEGIGLAHVRALAYRLGGNILCRSQVGTGSVFSLVLPPVFMPRKEG